MGDLVKNDLLSYQLRCGCVEQGQVQGTEKNIFEKKIF